MIIEAIMLGHIRGPNPARQLAEKPDVVKKLTIYRDKLRALMTLGLGFEPCHESDLLGKALEIQGTPWITDKRFVNRSDCAAD